MKKFLLLLMISIIALCATAETFGTSTVEILQEDSWMQVAKTHHPVSIDTTADFITISSDGNTSHYIIVFAKDIENGSRVYRCRDLSDRRCIITYDSTQVKVEYSELKRIYTK